MKATKVTVEDKVTFIEFEDEGFVMRLFKAGDQPLPSETVLLEATLYKETRSFIPHTSYLFQLTNTKGEPLTDFADIIRFKAAIAFFFNSILNTDLFVVSIPLDSVLCPPERKASNFYKIAS